MKLNNSNLRRHQRQVYEPRNGSFSIACEGCPAREQKEKTLVLFEQHTYRVRRDAQKYLEMIRLETLRPGLVIDGIQDPYVYAESICNVTWIAPLEEGAKRITAELDVLAECAVNCTGVEIHGPFPESRVGTPLNRIIGVAYCPVAQHATLKAEAQQSVRHDF